MEGILNVLKPPGMTSHDVVAHLRRVTGERKAGHTGTLDPGAAGVLVVLLGRATRIAEYLAEDDKVYRVEMRLGVATDTGDAYGQVVARSPVNVTREALERAAGAFVGTIRQVPPMASAVRVGGERLYRRFRRGETGIAPVREVTVHAIRVVDHADDRALLEVTCSRGTYVRALVADIGHSLGCGAHVSFLVRTRIGRYRLADSRTLEELHAARDEGTLAAMAQPIDAALDIYPAVDLDPPAQAALMHGRPVPVWRLEADRPVAPGSIVRVRDRTGRLLAVGRVEGGLLRPRKVLA